MKTSRRYLNTLNQTKQMNCNFYCRLKIQVTISLTAFRPTGVTHEEENKTSRSYLNTLNQTTVVPKNAKENNYQRSSCSCESRAINVSMHRKFEQAMVFFNER